MIALPITLFSILEEELQEIFEGISPMVVYEYRFDDEGLYVYGVFPKRIERSA